MKYAFKKPLGYPHAGYEAEGTMTSKSVISRQLRIPNNWDL